MISPELCARCKGRLWCGNTCWILERQFHFNRAVSGIQGTEFRGSSPPSIFVSWKNYPKVSLAPLSPPFVQENASLLDEPEKWYGLPMQRIVEMRETLIRSTRRFDALSASDPSQRLSELQELALSSDPIEIEVELEKKPSASRFFSDSIAPMGPSAPLKSFELSENPRVDKKVDYIVSDTDMKSLGAIQELYSSGITVSHLHKLLSAGLLGVKRNRKLVPTRWAITAVDSNISKEMAEQVKAFPQISDFLVFQSHYLDNHFFVLLFPSAWCFEQLEAWQPGSAWTPEAKEPTIISDHEFHSGRKTYAGNVAGAYYSSRLGVCEHLIAKRRQAGCIVFREIGKGYTLPLGVWQIRENVRNALLRKPVSFSELSLALEFIGNRLTIPMQHWKKNSKVLDSVSSQKRIVQWMQSQAL